MRSFPSPKGRSETWSSTPALLLILALTTLLVACSDGPAPPPRFDAPPGTRVYDHVTVIDADGRRKDRAVAILNGDIVAVEAAGGIWPDGVHVIDATDRFIIPGLVDAHVHLTRSGATTWVGSALDANLHACLYHGVLAVMDVGSTSSVFDLRDRIARGEILGPTIRATGPFLTALGSHPCERFPYHECRFIDAKSAGRQAQRLIREGADGLKFALADATFTPWPTPRLDVQALIRAMSVAAEAGIPTIVHVDANADTLDAVNAAEVAGAEIILAHPVFAGPLSPEALEATQHARAVHTTLGALGGVVQLLDATVDIDTTELIVGDGVAENWHLIKENPPILVDGFVEGSRKWLAAAQENILAMRKAGVNLVVGTDAGYLFIPHGLGLRWELRALVDLGYSPLEALKGATVSGRQLLGLPGGRVKPGDPADLLILTADPLVDIDNVGQIETVILHGAAYPREDLRARDLYPDNASPNGGVCLTADDCATGLACDRLDNVCRRSCRRTFWSITGCGPTAWCMPTDALVGTSKGVCREETVRCDPNTQRGCEALFATATSPNPYHLSCQPLDDDTGGCRVAGDARVGETCNYTELGNTCAPGLYCSPLSGRCFTLCSPTAVPDPCPEPSTCQWQLDGAGHDWFGLCL
ncbi:MAG: amidohydrolase family protein [Deltaproteobacteria bacterium]|nr:amidohydrolase family protein [Deltaproteobacteria bacterium]